MKKLIVSIIFFLHARTKVVAILLALVGLLGLSQLAMAEDPVYFVDASLKAAVEDALGISDPTPTDMLSLTSLNGYFSGINDLTGIEYATNLTYLNLGLNYYLRNLSALSGLTNLTHLDLYENQIRDISALSGLTNLTNLSLGINRIRDISALSGLTNLTVLDLYENEIRDISALSGLMNLEGLALNSNYISDLSALSGLTNLTSLVLEFNQISNISALSGLTSLEGLNLRVNQISAISVLTGLTNLTRLSLGSNQISDISALSGLTNLTSLTLESNQISNSSMLSGLTNLTWLDLRSNQISDISALSGLTNLTHLTLRSNQISDISALSGLTNLTWLTLGSNPLNVEAYCTYLPLIKYNNPSIYLPYDPSPYSDCDEDGAPDACDEDAIDIDGDGVDDGEGEGHGCDNCPNDFNPGQEDFDEDGIGDVCDECNDTDGDGYGNPGFPNNTCPVDNCPDNYNPGQEDADGDGIGDACENCIIKWWTDSSSCEYCEMILFPPPPPVSYECSSCPSIFRNGWAPTIETSRTQQATYEAFLSITGRLPDSYEDFCYNYSVYDIVDYESEHVCQNGLWSYYDHSGDEWGVSYKTSEANGGWNVYCGEDSDGDGLPDSGDNCPNIYNPKQTDTDGDGIGDVCELCPTEEIYGEYSEEAMLLRNFRDEVLNKTPEGKELIILYYQWSPEIVRAMENEERAKEELKEMIDGILGLVGGEVK